MLSAAVKQLQAAKQKLAAQISGLEKEASKINNAIKALSGLSVGGGAVSGKGKYKRTAAQRRAMAKAQKARWAKINAKKAGKATVAKPAKKKGPSAAGIARIKAAQKARWAKIKAAKKK